MKTMILLLGFAGLLLGPVKTAQASQSAITEAESAAGAEGAATVSGQERASSRARTFIIAGWSMVGGGWLLATAVGIPVFWTSVEICEPHDPSDDITGMACGMAAILTISFMPIPFFGPLVSGALIMDSAPGVHKVFGAFMILDSLIQLTGLSLAVAGHVMKDRVKKAGAAKGFTGLGYRGNGFGASLHMLALESGGGLGVMGYF